MGNPFLEDSNDLLVLDTKEIKDKAVTTAVRKAETLGQEQYNQFIEERLVLCTTPLTDVITKNRLSLLSTPPPQKVAFKRKAAAGITEE